MLRKDSVDAIVSDQDMPGLKGTELLTKVHELYPDSLRYMLTGRATLEIAISAINDGAISRFFTKPCNSADLANTIRQGLEYRDLMIQARRLLKKVKRQEALLNRIEVDKPGITQSASESIEVINLDDEISGSYDDFIDELHRTLGTSAEDEGNQQ